MISCCAATRRMVPGTAVLALVLSSCIVESTAFLGGAQPAAAARMRPLRATTTAPISGAESPAPSDARTPAVEEMRAMKEARDGLKKALLEELGSSKVDPVLACPVSLRPLSTQVALAGPFVSIAYKVSPYGTRYRVRGPYTDLVDEKKSDAPFWKLTPREIGTQELFRSPFTSFLYERGWRQNFERAGFPGIDKEAAELLDFLKNGTATGTIVDLSCGSGLMTRRLVKSGMFERVIAADYSESMLLETDRRFRLEGIDTPELIRCDAARLPFQTGSLDAVHAGAALHCWPQLEDSLREVYRVLKPGGRFYASTFEAGYMGNLASNTRSSFRFFQLNELRSLLMDCGFAADAVDVRREGSACLIAKCVKQTEQQLEEQQRQQEEKEIKEAAESLEQQEEQQQPSDV